MEVKSGAAKKDASQKKFDADLNSKPENKATGTGKNKGKVVGKALEIRKK